MGGIIGTWRSIPQALMATVAADLYHVVRDHAAVCRPDPNSSHRHCEDRYYRYNNAYANSHAYHSFDSLPIGLKGLLAVCLLFYSFTGTIRICIRGVQFSRKMWLCPSVKKPCHPKSLSDLLRFSIVGVGVFGFLFSLFYKENQNDQ